MIYPIVRRRCAGEHTLVASRFLEDVSFSQEPRLVYLDTDSVLLGDVTGLAKTPLRGHAVAAPRWGSELESS